MSYRPKWLGARVLWDLLTQNLVNNENADLTVNRYGALYVQTVGPEPSGGQQIQVNQGFNQVASVACNSLVTVNGFNPPGGGDVYVQFFLHMSSLTPGEVPIQSLYVPAGSSFSWTPSSGGLNMGANPGWTIAVSSTPDTYTADTTDIWWFAESMVP